MAIGSGFEPAAGTLHRAPPFFWWANSTLIARVSSTELVAWLWLLLDNKEVNKISKLEPSA
jgi:hypothetical protein